jgi:hypothetical protein
MFPMPIARQRCRAVEKGPDALVGHFLDRALRTDRASKGVQQPRRGAEISAGGLAMIDVLSNGLVGRRHSSPSRLTSATCRKAVRCTLA